MIDWRGCDESIFVTLCTQVSGPPWPLPSGPFSLSNKPLPIPPLNSVIGSLTSLCLAHSTGSDQSNQSTAQSIIGQLALTFSSPQTTRFQSQPAHSSILTHIHTEKPHVPSTQVHQVSVEFNCLRRPHRLYINGHSAHSYTSQLLITCLSFFILHSSKWPPIPITAPDSLVNGLGPSIC